jgi:hypothetical protein
VQRRRAGGAEPPAIDDAGRRQAHGILAVVAAPTEIERERLPRVEEGLIERQRDGDAFGEVVVATIQLVDLRLQAVCGAVEISDSTLECGDFYCLGVVGRRVLIDLDLLIGIDRSVSAVGSATPCTWLLPMLMLPLVTVIPPLNVAMFWKVVDAPVNVVAPSDIWNVAADPMRTAVGNALGSVGSSHSSVVAMINVPPGNPHTALMFALPDPS